MRKFLAVIASAALVCGCASSKPAEQTEGPVSATAEVTSGEQVPVASAPEESAEKGLSDDELRTSQNDADLMIYESWPQETTLDNAHIANVVPVWLDAINGAKETIDFSEYYAINEIGTGLDKVMKALKAAAERGVKIRFIVDAQLNKDSNADLPQELARIENVTVRQIEYSKIAGGVQHAKYFIVDGKTAYFGSQNFDWRSLEQISEMGARLRPEALVEPLKQIFELDWKLAENPEAEIGTGTCSAPVDINYKGEQTRVETVASPQKTLLCKEMWDLPKMIDMIGKAKKSVSVQLLNYATKNYDKTKFMELDDALTGAASRGVKVRLMVSDWSTKPKNMADMKRLAAIDNIEVRMIEIPEHSSGFQPYSRTIHSKFMVVDDADSWLGTSNWAGDYFYKSRNVGIIVHGKNFNDELTRSFDHYWESDYAIVVDPDTDYPVKDQSKPSH